MSFANDEHPTSHTLQAFVRGLLATHDSLAIEAHVTQCASCCSALDRASETEVPDEFVALLQATQRNEFSAEHGGEPSRRAEPASLRISGYEILEEVGRGGMGVVYKARQLRLNRLVALKVMVGDARAEPSSFVRFRAEAEAVARIQHPNIIQIFEVREVDGTPFIALEFAAGGTLEKLIRGVPQPSSFAAQLLSRLARAAEAAHRQGIVHRDLKPANIVLMHDWARANPSQPIVNDLQPKITDFGLAKWLSGDHNVTRTGVVAGTPSYMSPEQASGHADVGAATDIYALGAILYELLTGRPPFRAASALETLSLVCTADPVAPRRLQPRTPIDLETICLKCLEKQPARRYATANALADDIDRFLRQEPIEARPLSAVGRLVRWSQRRPGFASMVFASVVIAIAGLAGILWQWSDAVRERGRAEANEKLALQAQGETSAALERAETQNYFTRIAQARLEWRLNHDRRAAESLLDLCRPAANAIDRRHWEWYYLKNLTAHGSQLLGEHRCPLTTALAVSSDGAYIASAADNPFSRSSDRELRAEIILWDGASGACLQVIDQVHRVNALHFSHDRKLLVAMHSKNVVFWELVAGRAPVATAQRVTTFDCEGGFKERSALHAASAKLALVLEKGGIAVVDIFSEKRIHTFACAGLVCSLRFSGDGERLYVCTKSAGSAQWTAWDVVSGRQLVQRSVASADFTEAVFSADCRWLAIGTPRATVWEVETGRLVTILGAHDGSIHGLDFSPDGTTLAGGMVDRTARLWHVASGEELGIYRGHTGRVRQVAFHPRGTGLVTGGEQGAEVRRWNLQRSSEFVRLNYGGSRVAEAVAFDPDSRRVLAAIPGDGPRSARGMLLTIDPETEKVVSAALNLTSVWHTPATLATFTPDASRLAAISEGDLRVVNVWRRQGEEYVAPLTLQGHDKNVYQLAFSDDGRFLASAGQPPGGTSNRSREIIVWNLATGQAVRTFTAQTARTRLRGGLALSSDGSRIAFGYSPDADSLPSRLRVCEVASGSVLLELEGHEAALTSLAFSHDGQLLASADEGTEQKPSCLRIWRIPSGSRLHKAPLESPGYQLAFSPDNRRLAAVDRRQLKLWDVASGQEAMLLQGTAPPTHDPGVNPQVAWSIDGQRLLMGNHDRSLTIWEAPAETPPGAWAPR